MRADPSVFDLPVEKIRSGYYSDAYFNRTKELLEADRHFPNVTMQVFQKRDAVLGGIDEAIAVLKRCSGKTYRAPDMLNPGQTWDAWVDGWDRLEVYALDEADFISPREPVMHIVGPYHLFAHLETVYLGILARRTMIATNVRRVLDAATASRSSTSLLVTITGKSRPGRLHRSQGWRRGSFHGRSGELVGWQGHGHRPACTDRRVRWRHREAAQAYAKRFAGQTNISVLVDFENDSVGTSLKVAEALGYNLWGVRLDTSETLVDRSLWPEMGSFKPTGVNPRLVETVRAQLDAAGYHWVRIIASGGFTADKIKSFEDADVPVDAYGVGASLIHGDNAYTADIVRVDGKPCAKVGREYIANSRLELVT
jgi:nicotinate phosphoribosyltransferase